MNRNRKDIVCKWDSTDEWALRTFGYRSPMSRKALIRDGLQKAGITQGREEFNALFAKGQPVLA